MAGFKKSLVLYSNRFSTCKQYCMNLKAVSHGASWFRIFISKIAKFYPFHFIKNCIFWRCLFYNKNRIVFLKPAASKGIELLYNCHNSQSLRARLGGNSGLQDLAYKNLDNHQVVESDTNKYIGQIFVAQTQLLYLINTSGERQAEEDWF